MFKTDSVELVLINLSKQCRLNLLYACIVLLFLNPYCNKLLVQDKQDNLPAACLSERKVRK